MARAFARLALIQCCSERDETIRPSDEGNIKVAPGVRGDAAGLRGSADFRHPFFRGGHMARHRDETVGRHRQGINPAFNKEFGEVGVVARRLAVARSST